MTGSLGYFGNRSSFAASSHSENHDPRDEVTSRAYAQVAHNPASAGGFAAASWATSPGCLPQFAGVPHRRLFELLTSA
jgi:hypothetical protein